MASTSFMHWLWRLAQGRSSRSRSQAKPKAAKLILRWEPSAYSHFTNPGPALGCRRLFTEEAYDNLKPRALAFQIFDFFLS